MRIEIGLFLAASLSGASAFAPQASFLTARSHVDNTAMKHHMAVDPNMFFDDSTHHLLATLSSTLTTALDADAATAMADQLSSAPDVQDMAASMATPDVADVAEAAGKDNGWFGFLTGPIGGLLQVIHSVLVAVGLDANAWGVSIITLTLVIKAVTFPLTKTQLESTNKMQAMQPAIKEIQAKYQSNPEVMNQKMAEFYQTNDINPLAGCLPSLVQIPVFIGLYRSVLDLAKENKLDEPFLFLPNLEGPVYGADPAHGSDWILSNWVDGTPSLGWEDTIAFLILPVFLVISQFVSMELMQPKTEDGQGPSGNIVLKVLPIMIGWFALNVPAALSVYWVVNNIVTTGTSLYIRSSMKVEPPVMSTGGAAVSAPPPTPIFTPPREKPAGFGDISSTPRDPSAVKPLTPVVDAEVVEAAVEDEVVTEVTASISEPTESAPPAPKKKQRGKKKRKKRN